MNKEAYISHIKDTLQETNTKNKKFIVKLMKDNGIATGSPNTQFDSTGVVAPVEIFDKELDEQLRLCFKYKEKEAVKQYEMYEFIKDYKYSTYFDVNDFDSFWNTIHTIQPLVDEYENDYVFDTFVLPVVCHQSKYEFLKFNLHFSTVNPVSLNEVLLKYPFIVVLHKESRMVEFRFDSIKRIFRADRNSSSYILTLIKEMVNYIQENYQVILTPIDLNYMISVSKNEKNGDIQLISQYMKFVNGGRAQLEVGNNKEYILPFIDELKSILSLHAEELKEVPKLKEDLDDFVFEKDEMSDYPWIEVLWPNEIKTRNIHAKFTFNYEESEYNIVQHYYSNVLVGMERMNYVAEYISNHRNDTQEENG